jgi:rhodanese-related sulfurtransferase
MAATTGITPEELIELVGTAQCPPLFDVRREEAFRRADTLVPAARWRDHRAAASWAEEVPPAGEAIVYCLHGEQVSQAAASLLRLSGRRARVLAGGFEGYLAAGGPTLRRTEWLDPAGAPSRWVTRDRPKIDRIACPWLIRRFVDPRAEIHFVAHAWVREAAEELQAIPFDIPDVAFSHVGETCSFDTFLDLFGLDVPGLRDLAVIVRGADTDRHRLSPQAPGLLAVSLGLSLAYDDDLEQLEAGMILYDALYAWCRSGSGERHDWQPDAMRRQAAQA